MKRDFYVRISVNRCILQGEERSNSRFEIRRQLLSNVRVVNEGVNLIEYDFVYIGAQRVRDVFKRDVIPSV